MSKVKRLWTDEEITSIPKTVEVLRRMRTAATMQKPKLVTRAITKLNNFFGGQGQIYSQQEALLYAERLADAAGDFFAAKLSRTTQIKQEYEKWQDLLLEAEKRLVVYRPTTFIGTSLREVVGKSIIGRLRHIAVDSHHTLQWDLLENNNIGATTVEELINENVGVFSPLSGDYLMATFYSSYLRRTRGKTFLTRAVALDKNLGEVFFPLDYEGKIPFSDKPSIGIYIDTTETGASWENLALQGSLFGLVVHGMEGFDYNKARELLNLPKEYSVEMMIALGKPGDIENLDEGDKKREFPKGRKPLKDIAFEGRLKL
ncbi:hypothetical protein HYW75_03910 [Candidatus Pacearchaeota archaeon]|nr:hypothetical protein [Candidatus Pacearchaeota archaeon]